MAGWHHRLDGQEFERTSGDGNGQGGLACCNSWGRKDSDTTEKLHFHFHLVWSSGFPYFLQCKSEFGNKEFMVCATVILGDVLKD